MRYITTISDLKQYLTEMLLTGRIGESYARIEHARNLDKETVLAIAGNLVMHADDDSIEIGTRTTVEGIVHDVNQCWFTTKGDRYAIVYHDGSIEVRNRDRRGAAVCAIDRTTTPAEISEAFDHITKG
jgi:hypothetical protein